MFSLKKTLPLLFVIVIILLSSCDGRDKAFRTAQQDLIENKVLDTFSSNITIVPETYFENVTDTLFSNGYHVYTKFYANMKTGVLITDSTDIQTYYRDIIVEIKVTKNNKEIFNNTIDKHFLLQNNIFDKEAVDTNIISDFWFDFIADKNGFPILILEYMNPKTKKTKVIRYNFPEKGLILEEVK